MPKVFSPLDMQGNEIRNFVLQYLTSQPNAMLRGRLYYDSILGPAYFDGTKLRPLDSRFLTDGSTPIASLDVNPLDRSKHTGSQAASTISDLKSTVTGYTLNEFAAPNGPVAFGNQRLTGLPLATADSDATPLGQIRTLIAQAIAGQTALKNPARAAASGNVTLSGLQTIDGYTLKAGDRVLVTGNTNASQNGLWAAAAGAWTRTVDADEPAEWTEGTEILVLSGTQWGGTVWRQTASGPVTVGTSPMNFTVATKINTYTADEATVTLTGMQFSVKMKPSGGIKSDSTGIMIDTSIVGRKGLGTLTSDGATTEYNVRHDLNNNRPMVQVYDNTGTPVQIDWVPVDSNSIKITFGTSSIPPNGSVFQIAVAG